MAFVSDSLEAMAGSCNTSEMEIQDNLVPCRLKEANRLYVIHSLCLFYGALRDKHCCKKSAIVLINYFSLANNVNYMNSSHNHAWMEAMTMLHQRYHNYSSFLWNADMPAKQNQGEHLTKLSHLIILRLTEERYMSRY